MPYVGQKPADIIATAVDTTTGTFSGEVDAASLDISGNIDVDGTTNLDVVDIDGAVDMASTLAVAGAVTANAGVVVDEMTLDADTLTATDDFIIDAVGDITLDADGGSIALKDGGTQFGLIAKVSEGLGIYASVADKDIFFKGTDGSSNITALTLDMSAGGNATFNGSIFSGGNVVVPNGNGIDFSAAGNVSGMTSELLDDYEEGTWTPTVNNATGYGAQFGKYIKVGRLVHVYANVELSSQSAVGNIISGLPFSSENSANSGGTVNVGYYSNLNEHVVWISGYVLNNSTGIYLSGNANGHTSATIGKNGFNAFKANSRVMFSISYHSAA